MVQRTGGRLSFRPGTMPGALRPLGSLTSDTSGVALQSTDLFQDMPAPEQTPSPSISTAYPFLYTQPMARSYYSVSRKRNKVRVHKDANALTKSSNKLKKQTGEHADERECARDDVVLEVDSNNVLTNPKPPAPSVSGKQNKAKARQGVAKASAGPSSTAQDERPDDSDVPSEVEEQERAAKGKNAGKGVQAFQQHDLVSLALAGDNVVQVRKPHSLSLHPTSTSPSTHMGYAFEEAKPQETEADAPREVDTTLPGWVRLPIISHTSRLMSRVPGLIPQLSSHLTLPVHVSCVVILKGPGEVFPLTASPPQPIYVAP
jgi:U3 small nucleolar RNA-associated protein 14